MANPRAEKALMLVAKGSKTLSEAMVKAGYSPKTARHPSSVFGTKEMKPKVENLIARINAERDAVLERMKETRDEATFRDLNYSFDILTKNAQLLGDKPTDIMKIPIEISGTIANKNGFNSSTG